MKVIKIPYDTKRPCTVHNVEETECCRLLDKLKELIQIEWAEIVLTFIKGEDPHRDYVLIVDEVGKLKDEWFKKINPRASKWYAGSMHGDPIVGDVILMAREWNDIFGECDLVGLTDYEEVLMFYMI